MTQLQTQINNKIKFSVFKILFGQVSCSAHPADSLHPAKADDHFGSKHGTVNLPAKCCCFQMSSEPTSRPCGQAANACFHCRCGRPTKKLCNSSGCEHAVMPDYCLCLISNSKVKLLISRRKRTSPSVWHQMDTISQEWILQSKITFKHLSYMPHLVLAL